MKRLEVEIPWYEVKNYMDENEILGTNRHINKYLGLIEQYFPDQRIFSVRKLSECLDMSRLTIERRFIKEGLPHYEVKFVVRKSNGSERKTSPRDRLYIQLEDLLSFMVDSCGLTYEHNEVDVELFPIQYPFKDLLSRKFKSCSQVLVHRRERFPVSTLRQEHRKMLGELLLNDCWSSMLKMQEMTDRSRSSMVLLGYMIDSLLLPFAGKHARRYLVEQKFPLRSSHIESLLRDAFRLPILSANMVNGSEPIRYVTNPDQKNEGR